MSTTRWVAAAAGMGCLLLAGCDAGSFGMSWNYAGGAPGGSGTAAPAPTTADPGTSGTGVLAIAASGNHDCAGRDVQIAASAANVDLTGKCGRVEINGSTNHVDVATVASLLVNGSGNNTAAATTSTRCWWRRSRPAAAATPSSGAAARPAASPLSRQQA